MALQAGYYYIQLGTIVFTTNPSIYRAPRSDKPLARSRNLTATITQSWDIVASDEEAHIEWNNLDKATCDLINALYKAKESVTFIDVYNTSYTVVISNFTMDRRLFLDSQGFRVVLDLVIS